MTLSGPALTTSGVLLLSLVAVEWGGRFLLRISTGAEPVTEFQRTFFRAGHAHAGVLVVLALVIQPYVAVTGLSGGWELLARLGAPAAAILVPAGFFLSAAGRDRDRPNRLVALVWVGAVVLAAGLVTAGIGLIAAA